MSCLACPLVVAQVQLGLVATLVVEEPVLGLLCVAHAREFFTARARRDNKPVWARCECGNEMYAHWLFRDRCSRCHHGLGPPPIVEAVVEPMAITGVVAPTRGRPDLLCLHPRCLEIGDLYATGRWCTAHVPSPWWTGAPRSARAAAQFDAEIAAPPIMAGRPCPGDALPAACRTSMARGEKYGWSVRADVAISGEGVRSVLCRYCREDRRLVHRHEGDAQGASMRFASGYWLAPRQKVRIGWRQVAGALAGEIPIEADPVGDKALRLLEKTFGGTS